MTTDTLRPPVGTGDHRLGAVAGSARVEITAFGDYECPYSRRLDRLVREELMEAHGSEVAYIFRHFPLGNIHPAAFDAAAAAEAAGAQGRFWEIHTLLYDHQRALARSDLVEHAKRLDLDVERFTRDLEDGAHAERVRADLRSGVGSGVRATPTAFLNGQRWEVQALDEIVRDVEQALRAPGGRWAGGG
jgi:protein-disulfide isomerase